MAEEADGRDEVVVHECAGPLGTVPARFHGVFVVELDEVGSR